MIRSGKGPLPGATVSIPLSSIVSFDVDAKQIMTITLDSSRATANDWRELMIAFGFLERECDQITDNKLLDNDQEPRE